MVALAGALGGALAGCGQRGPLYLPNGQVTNAVPPGIPSGSPLFQTPPLTSDPVPSPPTSPSLDIAPAPPRQAPSNSGGDSTSNSGAGAPGLSVPTGPS